jgi:hypothetical protein
MVETRIITPLSSSEIKTIICVHEIHLFPVPTIAEGMTIINKMKMSSLLYRYGLGFQIENVKLIKI